MTMKNFYDLAVIGAGPARIVGATTAASLGARVILIDRFGDLGGADANTGTVPSKTLRETALALSGIRSRDLYGDCSPCSMTITTPCATWPPLPW
jgi:NAD(P) transhydrogenase